jgi:putative phosphonate metabolism protein
MDEFLRYALYLVPEGALGRFGDDWLGWDMARGVALGAPGDAPAGWAEITAEARRYGFHATIKPPFRLMSGRAVADLQEAVAGLCATIAPFDCDGLRLASLDGFLALVPEGETHALDAFAARVVMDLDGFRAPAPEAEIARRRAAGLSARQEEYLLRWGYPYVLEEFRAHFTLTGRLDEGRGAMVTGLLGTRLSPVPLRPFRVESLCLVGEQAGGGFRVIQRYGLSG